MARSVLCFLPILFLASSLAEESHYFESVSYSIETSQVGTSLTCELQVVSLQPNLSSVDVRVPYPSSALLSQPILMVGKSVVTPSIRLLENETVLTIGLGGMKVGQVKSVGIWYIVRGGIDLEPGSRVEVRTLGLGAEATAQALSLKLRKGLTISMIETPYGSVRPGKAGAVLSLGGEPTRLVLVVRHTNLLDNRYVVWGIAIAALAAVPTGWFLYRRRRRRTAQAT